MSKLSDLAHLAHWAICQQAEWAHAVVVEKGQRRTGKKWLFADNYLVDMNATRAYREVYKTKSDHAAASNANRLLKNPLVLSYVAMRQAEMSKKLQVTQEQVVAEFKRIAFANPRLIASWNADGVTLHDSEGLSDDAAAAIAEVSETPTKIGKAMRFRLHDKVAALTALGRHLGMFVDHVEVTVNDLSERMKQARERAKAAK